MTPADIAAMAEPADGTVLAADDFAEIWRRQGERWHDLTYLGVGPQTWEYVRARLARRETVRQVTVTPVGALPTVNQLPLIRRAIADPAKFTERVRYDDSYESRSHWSARAVVIALGGAR